MPRADRGPRVQERLRVVPVVHAAEEHERPRLRHARGSPSRRAIAAGRGIGNAERHDRDEVAERRILGKVRGTDAPRGEERAGVEEALLRRGAEEEVRARQGERQRRAVVARRRFAERPGVVEVLDGERVVEIHGDRDVRRLVKPGKGLKPGAELEFAGGLGAQVEALEGGGQCRVRFLAEGTLGEALLRAGQLPLPPYIAHAPTAEDEARYQTVYARAPGSVAAPTAGLHLTPRLLARLSERGISTASVTLDIGPGTFLPVRTEDESQHRMHPERFRIPEETARAVTSAKAEGRRVVAVGTTVVRTLETAWAQDTGLQVGEGETELFLRPGAPFGVVEALLTNFHLPRSTLLMLVAAFASRERVLAAYREAVALGYRFFSYGDAMLVEDSR